MNALRRHTHAAPSIGRVIGLVLLILVALAVAASSASARNTHAFKKAFGEEGHGAGQMELAEHSGIALNQETGDLYVADTGNRRVDEFSSSGSFIRAFGADVGGAGVDVCSATCFEGTATSAPGGFEAPTFIAVDNSSSASKGDVYVGDPAAKTVTKFTGEGTLVSSWGSAGQLKGTPAVATGTGTTTSGSNAITELTTATGAFASGQSITGPGIPSGSVISGVEPTELILSEAATESATGVSISAAYSFTELGGIAVDSAGRLDVFKVEPHTMLRFGQDGAFVESFETARGSQAGGLALDPLGNIFKLNGNGSVEKLAAGGAAIGQITGNPFQVGGSAFQARGFAVDPANGDLYATDGTEINFYAFNGSGEVIEASGSGCTPGGPGEGCGATDAFGSPEPEQGALKAPAALAITPAHVAFAVDVDHQRLDEFLPGVLPDVETGEASGATESTATLAGTIDPDGVELTECAFEYGEKRSYGQAVPCTESPAQIGDGSERVAVHAQLSGLNSGRYYHFRLLASNSVGVEVGGDQTFTTITPQSIEQGACAGNEQLRRENDSLALPDCRAYELVSPADAPSEVYIPQHRQGLLNTYTRLLYRAAEDGNAVAYAGDPPASGGSGNLGDGLGDEFVAGRDASGWHANLISPPGGRPEESIYESISPDLSKAIFHSSPIEPPLSANAPNPCIVLYQHSGNSGNTGYQPLFTETQEPSAVSPCGRPLFAGANSGTAMVPVSTDLIFQTEAAMTPGSSPTISENPSGPGGYCAVSCNLYYSVPGHLALVNVLPGGSQDLDAVFGAQSRRSEFGLEPPNFSNVLSADGSRAFWTDVESGTIYMRENPGAAEECLAPHEAGKACTVQVSGTGPATYWTATPDGRYAYYTEGGQLWRFDSQTDERLELTPPSAEVQGVVGINEEGEDGSYLYFVAAGALSGTGAEDRSCTLPPVGSQEGEEENQGILPAGRGCNLYLLHDGEKKFVTALSAYDDVHSGGYQSDRYGDWASSLVTRIAQVSSNGRGLVFSSRIDLTGTGRGGKFSTIYSYDSDTNQLSCVACTSSGAPIVENVTENVTETVTETRTYLAEANSNTYMTRSISKDGSRVFFNTARSLVPQDTNASECRQKPICRGQDVYEWERSGTGICKAGQARNDGGCLYLISAGSGDFESFLVDTDVSGKNVFFVTRDSFDPTLHDTKLKLYDAREDGGFPTALGAAPPCESPEACHGSSTATPASQSPGSSTFDASESIPPQRCRKGTVKKHRKCVSRKHRKARTHKAHKRTTSTGRRPEQ